MLVVQSRALILLVFGLPAAVPEAYLVFYGNLGVRRRKNLLSVRVPLAKSGRARPVAQNEKDLLGGRPFHQSD